MSDDPQRPEWGTRFLTDEADVFSHNAWDKVAAPDDQDEIVTVALTKQRNAPVPDDLKEKYNTRPSRNWDNFYKMNEANFFRNRKWLHREFPELIHASSPNAGPLTVAEIGCGAGNAAFPLLAENQNPQLTLRAFDYSSHAVKLVQRNPAYANPPVGSIKAAVWDLTSPTLPPDVEPGSVDIVLLIFVLSALHPNEWAQAVSNIYTILKPGGRVLLRDYGRYDLAQLRFRSGRLLEDNFYIRGDKTRVYFFELDELALLFTGASALAEQKRTQTTIEDEDEEGTEGVRSSIPIHTPGGTQTPSEVLAPIAKVDNPDNTTSTHDGTKNEGFGIDTNGRTSDATGNGITRKDEAPSPSNTASDSTSTVSPLIHLNLTPGAFAPPNCPPMPLFATESLVADRRLLVNRKRQLKMYRVWMQGKFLKLN